MLRSIRTSSTCRNSRALMSWTLPNTERSFAERYLSHSARAVAHASHCAKFECFARGRSESRRMGTPCPPPSRSMRC
eukprot:6204249-Pleurochrysis_carterae.AAC.1